MNILHDILRWKAIHLYSIGRMPNSQYVSEPNGARHAATGFSSSPGSKALRQVGENVLVGKDMKSN